MPRASPTSKAAKPVVPLILPVTAGIVVEDSEPDDMLGVFEAELGRNAHAHVKDVFRRQDFSVVLEEFGQICLSCACCPSEKSAHTNSTRNYRGASGLHSLIYIAACPLLAHSGHSIWSHLMSLSGVKRFLPCICLL